MLASLLLEPGRLELRDIEKPKAGPGEVVVRVRTALTCGTDLKTFRRGHPKIPMPGPFGHEFAGDVCEVGEGVKEFKVGDQIMAAPTAPCGECFYCKKGQENLCSLVMDAMIFGAYAEYVRVPEQCREKQHVQEAGPPLLRRGGHAGTPFLRRLRYGPVECHS